MGALEGVLAKVEGARQTGADWQARCPAHDDKSPSLSISPRTQGDPGVVVHCHAGCSTADVVKAFGMTEADLFDNKRTNGTGYRIVAEYEYRDEAGELLYVVERRDPKDFRQKRPDGRGGWIHKLGDTRRVLYRLDEVRQAVADGVSVFVVEGEKDADAIAAAGYVATCAPQGAGNWSKVTDAAEQLTGAHVVIVADKDKAGYKHAREVRDSLRTSAASLEVVVALTGKDAADHLGAGRSVEEFDRINVDRVLAELDDVEPSDEPEPDEEHPNVAESFQPIDLAAVIAGGVEQPVPTMLYRHGDLESSPLLYPGQINGAHGIDGSGKSWLADLLVAERVKAGETVMVLDLEDGEQSFISRLRLLGLADSSIVERVVYVRPFDPFGPIEVDHLLRIIDERNVTAVTIDSIGEAFGVGGINGDREEEVGPWMRDVPRRLAEAGPAVLIIDHSTKAGPNDLAPAGSRRKRAAVGGAQYLVEAVTPFKKGADGRSRITCAKDRHGRYRRGEHVAWLDLTTLSDGSITLELVTPAESTEDQLDPSLVLERRILQVLSESAADPVSTSAVRALVREGAKTSASNAAIADALERMKIRGRVVEESGPRNARLWQLPEKEES